MSNTYRLRRGRKQFDKAYTVNQIENAIRTGKLTATDQLSTDGGSWVFLGTLTQFEEAFPPDPAGRSPAEVVRDSVQQAAEEKYWRSREELADGNSESDNTSPKRTPLVRVLLVLVAVMGVAAIVLLFIYPGFARDGSRDQLAGDATSATGNVRRSENDSEAPVSCNPVFRGKSADAYIAELSTITFDIEIFSGTDAVGALLFLGTAPEAVFELAKPTGQLVRERDEVLSCILRRGSRDACCWAMTAWSISENRDARFKEEFLKLLNEHSDNDVRFVAFASMLRLAELGYMSPRDINAFCMQAANDRDARIRNRARQIRSDAQKVMNALGNR